jgi:large subunit ribosomal protein L29
MASKGKGLQDLSVEKLQELYQDKKQDMHTLRINAAMGELKDTSQIRKARHEIARILTVLRQRELAASAAQKDK